jgi:hypothetical protein
MWDEKGLYYLARIADSDPMKNATEGVDFSRSWRGDAVQLRMVVDPDLENEHQMHINLYHSTPEDKSYMIVHHGGLRTDPPYDKTGPARPDLQERLGDTMEAAGGQIQMKPWDNGQGYNIEAFMPWSYLRLNKKALKPGDQMILGWETLWAKPSLPGQTPESHQIHRLADGVKDASANRTFMFRARNDWGRVLISDRGKLDIAKAQQELQASSLAKLNDLSTVGAIPIAYTLPAEASNSEVTIAIDNAQGERVRNLFAQYPRDGSGTLTDWWDGLDDAGEPVEPGDYTAIVVDHAPFKLKLASTLYNAGTPPWSTIEKNVVWGSDHGAPSSISTFGNQVYVSFSMPEAGVGLDAYDLDGGIQWSSFNSATDLVATEDFLYTFEYNIWQKKFLISRIDPSSGRIIPFKSEDGSDTLALELDLMLPEGLTTNIGHGALQQITTDIIGFSNSVTIAYDGETLWLLVPHNGILKINPSSGVLEETRPIPDGLLSLRSRNDKVYGLFADKSLWRLDAEIQRDTHLLDLPEVTQPGRFGISQKEQRVAVADLASNQVFIYQLTEAEAKPVVIGQAQAGKERPGGVFDRDSVMAPAGVDFDAEGRLWVAEGTTGTHRTSVWNQDGSFADEFWGASPYGATHSYNLPHDATRFIALGTEFEVDYDIDPMVRKSEEKPLYYHPQLLSTQGTVHRYTAPDGSTHEFAVSSPGKNDQRALIIYRRDASGEFVPAAGLFPPIQNPVRRERTPFSQWIPDSPLPRAWVDYNGDAQAQPEEFTIEGLSFEPIYWSTGWVQPDMTILTPNLASYQLQEINKQGVPIYDFAAPKFLPNKIVTENKQGSTGTPIIDRAGNITDGIAYHTIDGRKGRYPNRFGRHDAPAAQRGLLIAPFRTNGVVEDVPGVGSVTMLQGDRGEWYLMSFDGLFLSAFFQDIKKELVMDETLIDGESFGGHFWRVTDGPKKGTVMLQSGKAAYYLFELIGLDGVRRQEIPLSITAEQIAEGQRLAAQALAQEVDFVEGPLVLQQVTELPSELPSPDLAKDAPLIAGQAFTLVQEPGNPDRWFKVSLLTDGSDLLALWQVADTSPWKNASDRFTHAFTGGDGVDLKFNTPGKGAIRLLTAPINGAPTAIFWQKHSETKKNSQTYVVGNNLANARNFDLVQILPEVELQTKTTADAYSVSMRVPLTSLGLDGQNLPKELLGLAGVIYSNSAGTNRAARIYWHDKATSMVNDVPTESGVEMERFGHIQIQP